MIPKFIFLLLLIPVFFSGYLICDYMGDNTKNEPKETQGVAFHVTRENYYIADINALKEEIFSFGCKEENFFVHLPGYFRLQKHFPDDLYLHFACHKITQYQAMEIASKLEHINYHFSPAFSYMGNE